MSIKAKIKDLQEQISVYKQIEKDNARFDRMSKSQKRIAIAEDVLASIKAKKYIPEAGTYVDTNREDGKELSEFSDAQLFLRDNKTQCTVCAIGAIFTSKVGMGNKCSTDVLNHGDSNDLVKNLRGIFTARELRIIEVAFEGSNVADIRHGKDVERAREWYESRLGYDDNKRLVAIMKNIIKNQGNFIP